LREGLTNEQIAQRLDISFATAKYHVAEIISKLGVQTREEAAAWQPSVARPWWQRAMAATTLAKLAAIASAAAVLAGLAVVAWAASQNGAAEDSPLLVDSTLRPTPRPAPDGFPTEDADWDPCSVSNLCTTIATFDTALRRGDLDDLFQYFAWESGRCQPDPERQADQLSLPEECDRHEPGGPDVTAVPGAEQTRVIPLGVQGSEGQPTSRQTLELRLRQYIDVAAANCKSDVAIRTVALSPMPEFLWAGEVNLVVAPSFTCDPDADGSPEAYLLALVKHDERWTDSAVLYLHNLRAHLAQAKSDGLYVDKLRYWPLQ
jgi:hypothetical protein